MKRIFIISLFILFLVPTLKSQVRIKMNKEGGVYTTPCTVNGLKLRFIFDTGASDVSLSLSEAIFMLKNGYLNKEDIHGSSFSQIANGDVVKNTTVNLKEIEIGGIKIHNVKATIIHNLAAPLLLGQSAIQKLGKIQIEGNQLLIMEYSSPANPNACLEAMELVPKAEKYYGEKLFALSAELFQKAYDICPNVFDCFDLGLLGYSYYYNSNFLDAIKYLEKAAVLEKNNQSLYFIYESIGDCYLKINKYEKSKIFFQKALFIVKENEYTSYVYSDLGYLYSKQRKFHQAIEHYKKAVEFYLRHLSTSENEVMRGKIKNAVLGEIYYNISVRYYNIGQKDKSDNYLIKSALCGDEDAINYCKKYNIKYELYIE